MVMQNRIEESHPVGKKNPETIDLAMDDDGKNTLIASKIDESFASKGNTRTRM
jgi:hypothetical protein